VREALTPSELTASVRAQRVAREHGLFNANSGEGRRAARRVGASLQRLDANLRRSAPSVP
jgi:hypothetical protein